MRTIRNLAAFLVCLLSGASALHAQNSLPQLWPTFSEPSTIVNVGLSGQSGNDFMAITSFQGAYNQQQLSTRLYVNAAGDANYWLSHGVPSGITITNLSYNSGDLDGTLKALLNTYGPQGSNTITKYVICDPYNIPESCNMATTLAGINDAMVVNPDNLSVISSYGLTQVADLRTYIWIGSNSSLVNSTVNMISNPSGGNGTTGWSGSGTLTATTYNGVSAIEWQLPANQGGDKWVSFAPVIPSARINTTPYVFSLQVAGSGTVFMDVWNGCGDVQSGTVALSSSYQTIQMAVPLPLSGCTGNSAIQLQVRAHNQSSAVTAYFNNAATIDNRVAIDTYQYNNLLSQTNASIVAQDFPSNGNLRDYQIAAKMFVFELTSNYSDESALYNNILTHVVPGGTARSHNTPVMGYVDNEGSDVPYLSESGRGLFLNASDDYNNGSVWASMPQPSSLSQPAPTAFKTYPGTIYVALAASDGDNSSIIEHQNVQRWTDGQYLGAVPMAWTMSPGMINFAPGIISNYYQFLPQSQEIMAGPSGIGYGTGETGSDLTTFASLTNQFMTAESMSTVTNWSNSTGDLDNFALDVNVPHVVYVHPQTYTVQNNSAHTVLDGQDVFYDSVPADEIQAIETVINANYLSTSKLFIEALLDNLTLSQDDTLYIAQKLQRDYSYPFVFMTPSELAASESGNGTATSSPQAVLGSTLNMAFPQNFIWNANGQEPGRGVTSTSWAIGGTGHNEALFSNQDFLGGGNMKLHVPGGTGVNCYAFEKLAATSDTAPEMVVGRYYRFSVNVAGTDGSTAFLTVYDGSSNHTATATLSSTSWTNISMIVQMQSATAGQIQVGVTPSTSGQDLYFSGTPGMMPGWYYGTGQGSGTASTASFGSGTYASAQGNAQAFYFNNPANDGIQWMNFYPTGLASGTTYVALVDVAGTGQAYLAFYNGSGGTNSSTVTLSNNWQTLTVNATASGSNPPRFQVVTPSSSSAQTVYFRNASLVSEGSAPLFTTGLESGQTQLSFTNTVDSASPGGGESNVSSAILQSATTASHGGTYAIQYGGTASGGSSTHAYMEAFTNGATLSSTSRLSYWIYPMSHLGSESGASSMTGLNSTCTAIDIIFTDGTALRNLSIKDQYGNTLAPAGECNHLQPDQWNYVTANLSSISGKTVSRIDVGYDQPGAGGNFGGYVDDITLSH